MFIRVTAPARLHFGLMQIDETQPHCYRGLGLMLDEPAIVIELKESKSFAAVGTETFSVSRMNEIVQNAMDFLKLKQLPGIELRFRKSPLLHSGLGTGTQTACAIATAIVAWHQLSTDNAQARNLGQLQNVSSMQAHKLWQHFDNQPHAALSSASGRGKRSHIGIAGFLYGDWIYDQGQPGTLIYDSAVQKDRCTKVFQFPEAWSVIQIQDPQRQGLSGEQEQASFDRSKQYQSNIPAQLLTLAEEDIIPSLQQVNFKRFAAAITTYNALAGNLFVEQRSDAVDDPLRSLLLNSGYSALGQSSWGPTRWIVIDSPAVTTHQLAQLRRILTDNGFGTLLVSSAATNRGGGTLHWHLED